MATFVSPLKKSLPLMRNSFTVLPFTFTVPSSLTSAPGSCLMSASSVEPSAVRKAEALNTVVSPCCSTRAAAVLTTAARRAMSLPARASVPTSRLSAPPAAKFTSRPVERRPTKPTRSRRAAVVSVTMRKRPRLSVTAPAKNFVVSARSTRRAVANSRGRPSFCETTVPVITRRGAANATPAPNSRARGR